MNSDLAVWSIPITLAIIGFFARATLNRLDKSIEALNNTISELRKEMQTGYVAKEFCQQHRITSDRSHLELSSQVNGISRILARLEGKHDKT